MALLAAGWSLACWGLHRLLVGPDWDAGGAGAWMAWLAQWRIPVWLAELLPMASVTALKTWLTAYFAALGPWIDALVAQAPSLLAWLAPLVWVGWALGLLVLATLGAAGSVLVVALRGSARR
ncbi:MAG: hypothetical protein Q7U26_08235 [Aquabacterium sp.]|nr:hypothetical protein [Aquabacterium sp.]